MDEFELYHWGIKGMRWGIRRYQNKDGSLTAAGRKRRGQEPSLGKRMSDALKRHNKQNKIRREARAKAKADAAEAKAKKELDDKKETVLKSRSAKDLHDNADLFTTKELQDAYNRLQLEANIKRLEPEAVNKGKAFAKNAAENMKLTTDVLNNGTALYNSFARIYNTFGKGDKLPLINTDKKKGDNDGGKKQQDTPKEEEPQQNSYEPQKNPSDMYDFPSSGKPSSSGDNKKYSTGTNSADKTSDNKSSDRTSNWRARRAEDVKNARDNLFDASDKYSNVVNSESGRQNVDTGREYLTEQFKLLEEPK